MTTPDRPPEIGALVHFEHVNLRVDDHRAATSYFVEGLGFTRDPYRMVGVRNMWVNLGHQQFHLPLGEPTPLAGEIGVAVPGLEAVRARLEAVGERLAGSAFSLRRENGTLATTTPWGHAVRVHDARRLPGRLPQHMPYVALDVPPGTAAGIARFYREVLHCPAGLAGRRGAQEATVTVGPHQHFRFRERKGAAPAPHSNHVAVYLTRYREIYAALEARGLIMAPDAGEQFRFRHIVDPDSGAVLHTLEHEMRSLYHPDFRKPLVNRVPVPYPVD